MNTDAQKNNNRSQGAGLFLAGANTLLLISISWHAEVHPSVGATNEFSMQLIQSQATAWFVLHLFFAITAALFAAAGLAIIGAGTRLTASCLGSCAGPGRKRARLGQLNHRHVSRDI